MRLGLTARVLSIAGAFLLALWLGLVAAFYWANGLTPTAGPPPEQLAAIAQWLHAVPAEARAAALPAIRSPILDVRLAERAAVPLKSGTALSDEALAPYRAVLGERLLSARIMPAGEGRWELRPFAARTAPREYIIAIDGQDALVAESRTPFFVTLFGLPAGVMAGLIGTVLACLALLMLHREIRPLARLAALADRIDPTGIPVPLPDLSATTPELRMLVGAIERLQARVHSMTRARLALIGGIQHDVRSFATRLRLRIEHLPDPAERGRAEADIRDMIELLDNALLTARAGVGSLDEEMLDLAELVRAEVADLRRAGRPVALDDAMEEEPVWVLADRLALRRVIGNIIDNAVKYGATARVGVVAGADEARLVVSDEGSGFAPDMRVLLLEPFVRAEPSRARHTGGAGLGLAVARGLVEAHGGTIALGEGPGGRVIVTLPLFQLA